MKEKITTKIKNLRNELQWEGAEWNQWNLVKAACRGKFIVLKCIHRVEKKKKEQLLEMKERQFYSPLSLKIHRKNKT